MKTELVRVCGGGRLRFAKTFNGFLEHEVCAHEAGEGEWRGDGILSCPGGAQHLPCGQSGQTIKQNETTFRLWQELHGNRPYFSYTRKDASKFRNTLLLLPKLHGEAKRYTGSILNVVDVVLAEDDALQKEAASKKQRSSPSPS